MTREEALCRKKIIESSLSGTREKAALLAVYAEYYFGNFLEAYQEERQAMKAPPSGFTFDLTGLVPPPAFLVNLPTFDYFGFGTAPTTEPEPPPAL